MEHSHSASVGNGDFSGDDDEQETSNSMGSNVKKVYHRHTPQQIQKLESFFRECPHPNDGQRRRLSRELGLENKQIKFWFQNKRTQNKTQIERLDNSALRAENEKVKCENFAIREAMKNIICPTCGGLPFASDERQNSVQMLQLENSRLKEEYGRLANILTTHFEKPIEAILEMYPASELLSSSGPTLGDANNFNGSSVNHDLNPIVRDYVPLQRPRYLISEMENALMVETAATALDELIRLLRMNEPLWFKLTPNDRLIIHRDSYDKIFHRARHFHSPTARIESSKDYGLVTMGGINLVEMFLDPNKWADLFPSIVTKASRLFVVESGMIGNQGGVLQLMHQQMHILSPLVSPREFYFLRYCQQIEGGIWVIVDVSYDTSRDGTFRPLCWKLPSGCMIQDLPNGCTKVTWVEHVEVDDKTESQNLYKDVLSDSCAYGAELWISTLQRMCQRITSYTGEAGFGREEPSGEERKGLMRLSHRMVKSFCSILSMSDKLDIPEVNSSGVRLSVHKNTGPGKPIGTILAAATSLWLPIPSQNVFSFLQNVSYRTQWDVLSNRNQVQEVVHISNGAHLGNCISVIKPYVPTECAMMILQETTIDQNGSMLVYAPIDVASLNSTMNGNDSSNVCILPSGFVICSDGRPNSDGDGSVNSRGSLLTVAVQVLVSNATSGSSQVNMDSVATVTTIISSTIQRIKQALNIPDVV